jgi:carbon-monoxide dehydrogenase small subunit
VNAHGKNITTIEGLTNDDGSLHPVQQALVERGAVQCGFCTSGMAMSMKALMNQFDALHHVPGEVASDVPTRDEIKKYIEGNLCRCTGYVKIIDAAEKLFAEED